MIYYYFGGASMLLLYRDFESFVLGFKKHTLTDDWKKPREMFDYTQLILEF